LHFKVVFRPFIFSEFNITSYQNKTVYRPVSVCLRHTPRTQVKMKKSQKAQWLPASRVTSGESKVKVITKVNAMTEMCHVLRIVSINH